MLRIPAICVNPIIKPSPNEVYYGYAPQSGWCKITPKWSMIGDVKYWVLPHEKGPKEVAASLSSLTYPAVNWCQCEMTSVLKNIRVIQGSVFNNCGRPTLFLVMFQNYNAGHKPGLHSPFQSHPSQVLLVLNIPPKVEDSFWSLAILSMLAA